MFGTDSRMLDFLKGLKEMEAIREKQLKNKQLEKDVIPREYVKKHIISYLSVLQERMLQDAPRTIAARAKAMVEGNALLEEVTHTVHGLISDYIKDAKASVRKSLRNV